MKCVKQAGKAPKRVSDEVAADLVKHGWAYCPKHEFKNGVVTPAPAEEKVAEEKAERRKKKKSSRQKKLKS